MLSLMVTARYLVSFKLVENGINTLRANWLYKMEGGTLREQKYFCCWAAAIVFFPLAFPSFFFLSFCLFIMDTSTYDYSKQGWEQREPMKIFGMLSYLSWIVHKMHKSRRRERCFCCIFYEYVTRSFLECRQKSEYSKMEHPLKKHYPFLHNYTTPVQHMTTHQRDYVLLNT